MVQSETTILLATDSVWYSTTHSILWYPYLLYFWQSSIYVHTLWFAFGSVFSNGQKKKANKNVQKNFFYNWALPILRIQRHLKDNDFETGTTPSAADCTEFCDPSSCWGVVLKSSNLRVWIKFICFKKHANVLDSCRLDQYAFMSIN